MARPLFLLVLLFASPALAQAPERLTIEEAVRIARSNHPTVTTSRRSEEVAVARTKEAFAGFLPSLTGSIAYQPQTANSAFGPSFQRAFSSGTGAPFSIGTTSCVPGAPGCSSTLMEPCVLMNSPVTGMPIPDPRCTPIPKAPSLGVSAQLFSFWSASLGVQWTVFDFGRVYYAWHAARETERAAVAVIDASLIQVGFDVKNSFYAALAAQESVRVAEGSVATQDRHVKQMLGFFQAGTRTRVDVAQTQADYANAELTLVKARGTLASARAQLNASLGLDSWHEVELVTPPEIAPASIPEAAATEDEAVARRPEPRQFEAQERAAEEQEKSVRGGFFPSLSLSLGPSFAGSSLGSLTPNFQVSVVLSYPGLGLNPYLIEQQRREQKANAAVAVEQTRAVRIGIRLEAAQAVAALGAAREEVVVARQLVAAAKERRDLADARFLAGVGTTLELSDAELSYVNAEGQVIQAQVDLGVAQARIDKALGR